MAYLTYDSQWNSSQFEFKNFFVEYSRFCYNSDAKFFYIFNWVTIHESGTIDVILLEYSTIITQI